MTIFNRFSRSLPRMARTASTCILLCCAISAVSPNLTTPRVRAQAAQPIQAATIRVSIVTMPPGATVYVDGAPVAGKKTPCTVELRVGDGLKSAKIAASLAGFDKATCVVPLEYGANPSVSLSLLTIGSVQERPQRLSRNHADATMIAYSPDGSTLATAEYKSLMLWKTDASPKEGARPQSKLIGHSNLVISVAYSPDGTRMATGSRDETAKIWNAATGELMQTLSGHADGVASVAWSPDGKTLATGSRDQTVKLWDIQSGQCTRTFEGHRDWITSIAYAPDGKTLASGSWDKTIKCWDITSGELTRTLAGHDDWVRSIAYSSDGKYLVSGSDDKTVKVWNAGGELLWVLAGPNSEVQAVAISPDSTLLAGGCDDRTVRLWDLKSGQLLRTLNGHKGDIYSVAWSPDGQTLASGAKDKTARLWNPRTGEMTSTLSMREASENETVAAQ